MKERQVLKKISEKISGFYKYHFRAKTFYRTTNMEKEKPTHYRFDLMRR